MSKTPPRAVHHAYLICGGSEQSRRDTAHRLAQTALCSAAEDAPCGVCSHCKKAAAGIHPDLSVTTLAEGKNIKTEQIRDLRKDAYIRPNEAARKVYLIDDAHLMHPSAQNALLKVLEEGPAYAVFLLTAPAAGLLLPTVVSRCQTVRADGEDAPGKEAVTAAATLAAALLAGDAREVLRLCVPLEKYKRDEIAAVLDALAPLLLAGDPQVALPLVEAVRTCRAACEMNVGAAHIAGYLAVSMQIGTV